ncbi:hypothetical protein ABZ568_06180 [Streptomyces olindensis]|uniref:Uncharacterized protein n=1 Tax=Streptomyces olindensis TaxID=358823 RepID=A0ABV2XPV2_9ACTN
MRAATATAPTRSRLGVESGTVNVALGPVTTLMNRARDAVRKAIGED